MIKIGGFNFIFTDAAHTLDSLNEMPGDVVLKQLPTSRASMENHCTEAVALLDTLASKTPLLEMIWKQLAALRKTRVHDGGKYLNQPPNNFQNGLQIGNCDILLNYDYFMMDAEDFYKNYDLDKPEILEAKRKTQAMQSAMPLVLITTLFHELGHFMETNGNSRARKHEYNPTHCLFLMMTSEELWHSAHLMTISYYREPL
jgi:hypothetical protein